MPIRIRLIRENGELLKSATDWDGLVERAAQELHDPRLIHYVDMYGDTYFNKLQMPDLLLDWHAAKTLVQSREDGALWSDLSRLAEDVQAGTHLLLLFVGD